MICVDTSVIIPWLEGDDYPETARLDELLTAGQACVAPVTITELMSDVRGAPAIGDMLLSFRVLDVADGYWERAGALRAALRRLKRKAPLGDALIAQACLDAQVPLLTRDADFGVYAKLFGLELA